MDLAAKHPSIVAELRQRIIKGDFAPGTQFPTHDELGKSFNVSRVTVQKALDRLASDGFVFAKGRRGTYVSEFPPHLYNYGIVFPCRPTDDGWVRFWTALANESGRAQSSPQQKIFCYFAIDGHTDHEDYQRMMTAVKSHRLAGLFFTFPPSQEVLQSILSEEESLPIVAVVYGKSPAYSVLELDSHAFVDKALDYLKSRGKRRIAMISVPNVPGDFLEYFQAAAASRRMSTKPYWIQHVPATAPLCARNLAHLLLNPDQKIRPDGLFITDDNLVEYATSGLIAANVRVPQDLDLVAHCNFPWLTPSVIPAKRLGFDAIQVLRAALESIDRQRAGDRRPRSTTIAPVFEEELIQTPNK